MSLDSPLVYQNVYEYRFPFCLPHCQTLKNWFRSHSTPDIKKPNTFSCPWMWTCYLRMFSRHRSGCIQADRGSGRSPGSSHRCADSRAPTPDTDPHLQQGWYQLIYSVSYLLWVIGTDMNTRFSAKLWSVSVISHKFEVGSWLKWKSFVCTNQGSATFKSISEDSCQVVCCRVTKSWWAVTHEYLFQF